MSTVIKITKEQLAELPLVEYPGKIAVIDTPDEASQAIAQIRAHKIVGFDTETKPSFRKGQVNKVALMQISTGDTCYLFRLNKIGLPEPLKELLEDKGVSKVGLSLKDDYMVLRRLCHFEPSGFVDLQEAVSNYKIADMSLQKMFAIIFGHRISKSQRLTNWEAPSLSHAQQTYASIDAWACLKIWHYLHDGLFDPESSPYICEPKPAEAPNSPAE